MENDDVKYASDEYYIKKGICPTCGSSICSECGMCTSSGHSEDCSYFNAKKEKENE